jgi:hypothetical protein
MMRYPDWEVRLAAYLAPLRNVRFAWGKFRRGKLDCCTFSAGGVKAMTGEDPMPEFRGAYASEEEAEEALKTIGAGSLIRTMNAKFERVPPSHAHRGDIVMVDGNLGIAFGDISLHVGAEGERQGLVRYPRAQWRKAWVVPMPGAANG